MNMLAMPLKVAISLIGIFWLFLAGIAYVVYLPAGWPNYPRFGLWTFHAPWAGAVQSERTKLAWANAQWGQCKTNEATLNGALATQEAAVRALASEGQRRTANATAAVQQAQARAVGRNQEIAAIEGIKPEGSNLCAAALSAIHAVPE